jgi:hypothetical protein
VNALEREGNGSYVIVMTEAKNPANEELTVCRDPARSESILSISSPKRFSIRPRGVVSWKRKVARTTETRSCLRFVFEWREYDK